MADMSALTSANGQRWAKAKLIRKTEAISVAKSLIGAKQKYQQVEQSTGVPWPVVAVIHERESSQDWGASIAQGDRWDRVSVHVPVGRGPFQSWQEAATDAFVNCAPFLARHRDWSIAATLTALEAYNGIGYANRSQPSPYIWAGTDQYSAGKYVRDGVYDPNKVDSQLGCAAMLMAMMQLDPSITLTGLKISVKPKPADLHEPDNEPNRGAEPPAPGLATALSALFSFITSLFRSKK